MGSKRTWPRGKQSGASGRPQARKHGGKEAKRPRAVSRVAGACIDNDEDLNSYIAKEGTFKDKVTALTLLIAKDPSSALTDELLKLAESENSDKAVYAIKYAVKLLEHAHEAKISQLLGNREFTKRFVDIVKAKMHSPFIKCKVLQTIKPLFAKGILDVQLVNLLLDLPAPELLGETRGILHSIVRAEDRLEISELVRDRLIETVCYKGGNMKRVRDALFLIASLPVRLFSLRSAADGCDGNAKEKSPVAMLMKAFAKYLVTAHENLEKKAGASFMKMLLSGIGWALRSDDGAEKISEEFMKGHGYIIFKLAYNSNHAISIRALKILERVYSLGHKVNYAKVLSDTIQRYTLSDDETKAQLLNMVLDIDDEAVMEKLIKSCYVADINGAYLEGAQIAVSENNKIACKGVKSRGNTHLLGMALLLKSHDPKIAGNARQLLGGHPLDVYNPWNN